MRCFRGCFCQSAGSSRLHSERGNTRAFGTFPEERLASYSAALTEHRLLRPSVADPHQQVMYHVAEKCLKELEEHSETRRLESLRRSQRRECVCAGQRCGFFNSPGRGRGDLPLQYSGLDSGSDQNRTAAHAVILPRLTAADGFDLNSVELSSLRLGLDGARHQHELICSVCNRSAVGGEVVLAVACGHAFCARCFESSLRSNCGEPTCPACGCDFARNNVHTLSGIELHQLWLRACDEIDAPVLAASPALGDGSCKEQVTSDDESTRPSTGRSCASSEGIREEIDIIEHHIDGLPSSACLEEKAAAPLDDQFQGCDKAAEVTTDAWWDLAATFLVEAGASAGAAALELFSFSSSEGANAEHSSRRPSIASTSSDSALLATISPLADPPRRPSVIPASSDPAAPPPTQRSAVSS